MKTADILETLKKKVPGLNKPGLILLAARPGVGKTTLAMNLALCAAKETTAAVFSLETSRELLISRFFSPVTQKKNGCPRSGTIHIEDSPGLTAGDIYAKCCRLGELGLVVIDYVQLISADVQNQDSETRWQAMADISRTLKTMAMERKVPVICVSQLGRSAGKGDKQRPVLSDFRESGALVQEADTVLLLYRDDYYSKDSKRCNITECIMAKNLYGETGTLELRWIPEHSRLSAFA